MIEGQREWRAMKVAAGEHLARVREHQRIVSRAAAFNLDNFSCVGERVANCSVHLGHATKRVRILHARIVFEVRLTNLALLQQCAQVSCDFDLSAMGPRRMYSFIESDRGSS